MSKRELCTTVWDLLTVELGVTENEVITVCGNTDCFRGTERYSVCGNRCEAIIVLGAAMVKLADSSVHPDIRVAVIKACRAEITG